MSELEISDSDFDPVVEDDQTCNYCNRRTQLIPNKLYCSRCDQLKFRECKRCKKPYHLARYFEQDDERCNSCHEKLQRERLKRAMKKGKTGGEDGEEGAPSKTLKRKVSFKAPAEDDASEVQMTQPRSIKAKRRAPNTNGSKPTLPQADVSSPMGLGEVMNMGQESKLVGFIPVFFK